MAGANKYVDTILNDDGQGVDNVTVVMKLAKDDSTYLSMTTDSSGEVIWDEEDIGYPGPIYVEATGNGVARIQPGTNTGQIGPIWFSDLVRAFRMMTDGVVPDVDNELAVTASGDDMEIDIATGMAFNYGLPFFLPVAGALTIGANSSGNPRIDLVVLRTYPPGTTDEGKQLLAVIAGTPASSPVAPTITQNTGTVWELALAEVLVENGASTIAADKVTDVRTYTSGPLVNGSVDTLALADGAVTNAKVAAGIDAAKIADGSVSNAEFQYIGGLTSDAQTQINNKANTSHTHNLADVSDVTASAAELNVLDGITATVTELNYTDGVTSAIQGQIDGKAATSHNHSGADITSGTINVVRLPTGIPAILIGSGNVSNTEFEYLDGVTSGIQAQINGRAPSSHNHAASAITSGTIAIARLPTGTSGSNVALGNHTHAAYALLAGATFTGSVTVDGGDLIVAGGDKLVLDGGVGSDIEITTNGSGDAIINGGLVAGVSGDFTVDVAGNTAMVGLTATDDAVIYGDILIGTATTGGKIRLLERTSQPSVSAGAAAGSGASASIIRGGSDTAGTIRISTGSSGVATGIICAVTFATARSSNEYLVIPTGQSAAAGLDFFVSNVQTTGFDLRCAVAPGTSATVDIGFLVIDLA